MGYAKKRQKIDSSNDSGSKATWKSFNPCTTFEPSSTPIESIQLSPEMNHPIQIQQHAESHGTPPLRLDIPPPQITPTPVLHQALKRQLPNLISSAVGALETQIVSILDVIIDNGSSTLAELTLTAVPSQGTTISVPSVGDITIPAATTTASSQPPGSSGPAITISVPGPSSQVVLSSPPSTPLPSSPTSAATTSAASSSYFSSSATSTNTLPSSSFPAPSNSTISTFTSTFSHTTVTGTTLLPLTTSAMNSTRLSTTLSPTTSSRLSASITSLRTGTQSSSRASASASTLITSAASASASASASGSSSTGGGIGGGGGIGSGGTATASAPSSSTSAAAGSANNSSMPPTPVLVGGVVGGVAGLTIVLLLLLVFFRWRRRKMQNRQLAGPDTEAAADVPRDAQPMSQRFLPTAFKRLRPAPAEPAPTERGFQNLGGRKIESVLTSGGDGFGDPGPSSRAPRNANLAGTSFLRDSRASEPTSIYTDPSSPGLQELAGSRVAGDRVSDTPEIVTMRPGPARTPVTSQGPFSPPPPRGTPPPQPLPRLNPPRDGIGRSHPGQDGSRGSRFAEDVT